jgi:uncharacterized protein (DUF1778 family)
VTASAQEVKRDTRIYVRVSSRQKETFEEAARSRSQELSAFVVDAVAAEAGRALSERTTFAVDAERWRRFNEALDRPAMDKPGLRALLEAPSVFDGDA